MDPNACPMREDTQSEAVRGNVAFLTPSRANAAAKSPRRPRNRRAQTGRAPRQKEIGKT